MLDGIDNNHKTGLLTVLIPSADAIETVSVSTSNYDAEFGRAGGAVTNVTLKSGTNQHQGRRLLLRQRRRHAGQELLLRHQKRRHQATSSSAWPSAARSCKNKLFFFADYQGTRDNLGHVLPPQHPARRLPQRRLQRRPTTIIYDPATGNADGTGRQPFPGNTIPANRISPIAQNLLAFCRRRTSAPRSARTTTSSPACARRRRKRPTSSSPTRPRRSDSLAYRFSFQRPEVFDPGTFGIYGGPSNGGFAGTGTNKTFSTALNWTRTFGSTADPRHARRLRLLPQRSARAGRGPQHLDEVGIRGANLDEFTSGLTTIEINQGYAHPMLGFSASLPWDRSEKTYNVASTFTKIKGNHTLKAGFDVRHNRDFLLQVQDNGGLARPVPVQRRPDRVADRRRVAERLRERDGQLPARRALERRRATCRVTDSGHQHWAIFTFIHDKWQVTPKLTIDLGLRHEYYTPFVGLVDQGGLSNFDPDTNSLRVAGYGSVPAEPRREDVEGQLRARARASPTASTRRRSLRGGYGASIIPFPDNQYAFNFPVKQNNQFNAAELLRARGHDAERASRPPVTARHPRRRDHRGQHRRCCATQQYNVVPLDLSEGKIHAWNVAFQRQLPCDFAGEVAYVANRGHGVLGPSTTSTRD